MEYSTRPKKEVQTIDPLDPVQALSSFKHFEAAIFRMKKQARDLVVKDDETAKTASEMSSQAVRIAIEVEKKRKAKVQPAVDFQKAINGPCGSMINTLRKDIAGGLDGKIRKHLLVKEAEEAALRKKLEEEAAEEQKRLEEEAAAAHAKATAEAEKNNEPPPPAPEVPIVVPVVETKTEVATDAGKSKLETKTDWELVDFRELPVELLKDREKFIVGAIKPWINRQIAAGNRDIPGVRIFEVKEVKTRAKR